MRVFFIYMLLCAFGFIGFLIGQQNITTSQEVKYILMPNAQLIFNKNQIWDSFTIQEKMFLCAYGSSGNKLSQSDLKEITEKYGAK